MLFEVVQQVTKGRCWAVSRNSCRRNEFVQLLVADTGCDVWIIDKLEDLFEQSVILIGGKQFLFGCQTGCLFKAIQKIIKL